MVPHSQDNAVIRLKGVSRQFMRADGSGVGIEVMVPALEAFRGDRLALLAPSGSGKTTLLNMLLLALSPTEAATFEMSAPDRGTMDIGAMWRAGETAKLSVLRSTRIAFVLQSGGHLPYLTARQNIELPSALTGRRRSRDEISEVARALNIESILDKRPYALSGGERQRVAVARALIGRPSILIADEPTASLDAANAETLMQLICDLCAETGTCLVVATHDTKLVENFGLEPLIFRAGTHPDGHPVSAFWRDGMMSEAV